MSFLDDMICVATGGLSTLVESSSTEPTVETSGDNVTITYSDGSTITVNR